jgi:hypothetical protein
MMMSIAMNERAIDASSLVFIWPSEVIFSFMNRLVEMNEY